MAAGTAASRKSRHRRVVAAQDGRHVGAWAQHVVGPGVEGHQVGSQPEGQRHLLVDDLVEEPAAHGVVRVAQAACG